MEMLGVPWQNNEEKVKRLKHGYVRMTYYEVSEELLICDPKRAEGSPSTLVRGMVTSRSPLVLFCWLSSQ